MENKLKNKFANSKEFTNASWIIAGRVIQMILSFIINILSARYLGPGNYGVINYIAAYIAFFTSVSTLGINFIIIKELIDKPEEQGEVIGSTLILRLISSILSSIFIVIIVYFVDYGEKTTLVIAMLCSVSLVFQVFDTFNFWFQSRYESKITAKCTLIAYLCMSSYRIFLLSTQKNVEWFAFSTSLDYAVYGLLIYYYYKKNNGPQLYFSFTKGRSLLKRSYHYIISTTMVAVYSQTDKLMLKNMLDETTVGYYALASSINTIWVFILTAIIDSMYPTIVKLYESDYERYERKNRQLYALVIYISLFVALIFMLFGKYFILVLYGYEYIPAKNPLKIVTWYTIFSYLGVARNIWLVCENKQKYLKFLYGTAVIINIILNYIFIPIWGASGAALTSLITQIITSMVFPYFISEMRPNVKLMVDAFLLRKLT